MRNKLKLSTLFLALGLMPKLVFALGEELVTAPVGFLASLTTTLTMTLASMGGFFAEAALQISLDIVNSAAVQTGFKIALTLANLGFVIAILVIAIATILRNQNYGMKQALVRLVVMAILVNFSLILAGAMINFSDRLTIFFVEQAVPNWGQNHEFSSAIIGSINPQGLMSDEKRNDKLADFGKAVGSWDKAFSSVIGSLMASIFTALFALAMWVMAITLFFRYTILSLLLIAMPIAWLAWIFPGTSQWWKKWWDKFIQWTLYAPAMMFFVYLAMVLATSPGFKEDTDFSNSEVANALGTALKGSNFLNTSIRMTVVILLMFGGFMAAKSMGVAMAGSAWSGAQSVGKKIWGKTKGSAGRMARRGGGTLADKMKLKEMGERWQQKGAGAGWLGRTLTAPVRGVGAQMTRLSEGASKGTLEQYKAKFKDMSEDERVNRVAASRGIEQIALLESLKDSKRFGEAVSRIPADSMANEEIFKRWRQGDLYKSARNASGLSIKEIADNKDQKPQDKLDEELIKISKSVDGEKFSSFFNPYDDKKQVMGMDSTAHKKWQVAAARGLMLGGSAGKVQKIMEHDNPAVRDAFVDAINESGLTWDEIAKQNKQLANWMMSKGRMHFGDDLKINIPEPNAPKPKKPAGFAASATTP